MASGDDLGKEIVGRYQALKSDRYQFENQWQDVQQLVRPDVPYFLYQDNIPGNRRTLNIFDSTAPWASNKLAGGLHSALTSTTDRWFNLATVDENAMRDDQVLAWLEVVSDLIYLQYSLANVRLATNLHENYLDLACFGTSILYQDFNFDTMQLRFRAHPLSWCLVNENNEAIVDQIYRITKWTYQQLCQQFGEDSLPSEIKSDKISPTLKYEVIHAVFPRDTFDNSRVDFKNKPFASAWVLLKHNHTIMESGFDEFPYHVARWATVVGEIYGRAPAVECLPSIKMINEMKKVMIRGAQKSIDPPLILSSDYAGKTMRTGPASIIYTEPGADEIKALEVKRDFPVGVDLMQVEQESIKNAFFLDALMQPIKKERQSVLERQQGRDEMLQSMAPHLGRLEVELCYPMLSRSYNLLLKAGMLPKPPARLKRLRLKVEYVSPAARAQVLGKANAINQIIQDLSPLMQVDPTVMDVLDTDAIGRELAILRDVTRRIIRNPQSIADIRRKRDQQKQMTEGASAAQDASGAALNIAKAQSLTSGPSLNAGIGS